MIVDLGITVYGRERVKKPPVSLVYGRYGNCQFFQYIKQYPYGIQGCEHGNVVLGRSLTDGHTVTVMDPGSDRARIYYIADVAGPYDLEDFVTSLGQLVADPGLYTVVF